MDMMLTGRTYGAEEGAAIGFSQYVVADGQGFAQGIALAKQIIANASLTNFGATQVLPRIVGANPETGLLMESLMAAIAGADDDARTRLGTFLEKRGSKGRAPNRRNSRSDDTRRSEQKMSTTPVPKRLAEKQACTGQPRP
jgi:enoyl-CoA hydratase/carnithine racemase